MREIAKEAWVWGKPLVRGVGKERMSWGRGDPIEKLKGRGHFVDGGKERTM